MLLYLHLAYWSSPSISSNYVTASGFSIGDFKLGSSPRNDAKTLEAFRSWVTVREERKRPLNLSLVSSDANGYLPRTYRYTSVVEKRSNSYWAHEIVRKNSRKCVPLLPHACETPSRSTGGARWGICVQYKRTSSIPIVNWDWGVRREGWQE